MNTRMFGLGVMALLGLMMLAAPPRSTGQAAPTLTTSHEDRTDQPLRLTTLDVDVKVIGTLATTTLELTFYNDWDRGLEGQFSFPLTEGQAVSRFALSIDGAMREGVVIEKAKGRQVFESIVRSTIDPGLLEQTAGNSYKARIFPIPAYGHKQIRIAYEEELTATDDGLHYELPLPFPDPVDQFSLRIEVFEQDLPPRVDPSQRDTPAFDRVHRSYVAEFARRDFRPTHPVTFWLPAMPRQPKVFLEEDPETPGRRYFYLTTTANAETRPKKKPRKIGLLWDASGSASGQAHQKVTALLEAYFAHLGAVEVELIPFRNAAAPSETFHLNQGRWDALRDRLNRMAYDGATQLGSLDLRAYACDAFLLVSDGVSNIGGAEITTGAAPVTALNASLKAEHGYLRYLAQSTGGAYLNLMRLSPEQALRHLTHQPYQFIAARYNDAKIAEVYPSIATPVDGAFSIAGILQDENATLTLDFGIGNTILHSETISLDADRQQTGSGLVRRFWAQKKIAELDMRPRRFADEITRLGKQFSIVTRNTSLLVLDRLEDYVEHEIIPPTELQKDYVARAESQRRAREQTEAEHLARVVELFEARKSWWEKTFEAPPSPPPRQENPGPEDEVVVGDEEAAAPRERQVQAETVMAPIDAAFDFASETTGANAVSATVIALTPWNPETPYLKTLAETPENQLYTTYLDLKPTYRNSSAFFLDVADHFNERGLPVLALRILSNLAEMDLENHQLLRILAYRLRQLGHHALAISVFEKVLELREEEPQSYRDLGLAYADDGQRQKAVEVLYQVVRRPWDNRFPAIQLIALEEMNAILATARPSLDLGQMDKRLLKNLPVDVRVALTWDADNTDMDLWVIDPYGEKCYYGHQRTQIGGWMSEDFTGGYGPEVFILKEARPGAYQIKVDYYGNSQQILAGATTIQVDLITDFGKPTEQRQAVTLRLDDVKDVIDVGTITVDPE